jgi:phosphate:Na+ symporter
LRALQINRLLGVAIGTMMTICVQSSAATIGILMAMAGQGLIPLEGAVPVLLGDNIGTCITAVLAAFHTNATAKRVALSHVLFNFFGCIIFVIFLGYFVDFVKYISPEGDISRQIANAHSAFNILNTCIFLPLAGPFIKLVEYILPEKGEIISRRPVYLDDNMLHTPGVALELATKEVVRMGDLAVKDVETALAALTNYDEAEVKYVLEHEPVVDNLEEDITVYLTKISATGLPDELSKRHTGSAACLQ